ncbi:30S ribosomal protein S7 [Patescibacteria group bacterium]|nr:30S ribosomal protein S7 [Patescibacteria group bacterium]
MAKIKIANYKRIQPDPKYHSLVVAKLINYLMLGGKKSLAQKIVYGAFEDIKTAVKTDPLEVFDNALKNIGPYVEIKSKRIGGANYQVPIEVSKERRLCLALRWIIESARNVKGKPMRHKLAQELLSASKKEGSAYKKREDTHRMAEANKAFAHYARF